MKKILTHYSVTQLHRVMEALSQSRDSWHRNKNIDNIEVNIKASRQENNRNGNNPPRYMDGFHPVSIPKNLNLYSRC